MRILIATPEAVPYVKTGGLADVTGALLKEFHKKNEKVSLILPLYSSIKENFKLYKTDKSVKITMGGITEVGDIWVSDNSQEPVAYFIDCDELYGRPELYGTSYGDYPDNAIRFIFFSKAVVEACVAMNIRPDVIHCNDWQTAMIPLYLKTVYGDKNNFTNTATVYTIHNLGYQGVFDASDMKYTDLGWDYFTPERLEFYGRLNFMKAGILYSDLITTVSRTYSREILEPENGFGLDGVLRKRQDDLYGIINGLNYNEWDPLNDALIPSNYGPEDMRGKIKCKRRLLETAGIQDMKAPLCGVITRLTSQKGIDLIYNSIQELMSMGVNLVILGKGDYYYQNLITDMSEKYSGRIFVKIGFDESLAHLIYAGSDFFIMPSKYEPCGLGQLVAMKYGAIPIVRNTGGLADTVQDYNHIFSKGTGFLFSDFTPAAMQDAVKRAICVFTDKKRMKKMTLDAMNEDFSWIRSAEKYLEIYRKALEKIRR
ncbi:MAG: glycogen synthase GlgA [Nitrospirota bacterium]